MSIVTASTPPTRAPLPGLGDFDESDLSIPRLKIDHRAGLFVDGLSNETFESLDVVVLGIVKGRILWDTELEDDAQPLCKSYDFQTGRPDPATFPWAASAFDRADFGGDEPVLDCASCPLKEWDSHPTKNLPWCTVQHTHPILMPDAIGYYSAPAVFTVQKTSLKSSKDYTASFVRAQMPMFTSVTRLSLEVLKKGSNPYAVAHFKKLDPTDEADWDAWGAQFTQIQSYLQTPRLHNADQPADESGTAAAPATGSAPVEVRAAALPADDEEFPF